MPKYLICLVAGFSVAVMATTVNAIPPDRNKIKACENFTASKYHISADQVRVTVQRRTRQGYFLDWSIRANRTSGYCFVTWANRTTRWGVEQGPLPEKNPVASPGVNEKLFTLPGYGDVIVNRGQEAIGDKQYFLVHLVSTARTLKWYALCAGNSDQVFDENGEYVGFDRKMAVMFPYVCEVSSLSPAVPRPQPR